jgi:tetratricopeptide (TPR) repeat protein
VLPNVGNTLNGNTTIGGPDPGVDEGNKPFNPGDIVLRSNQDGGATKPDVNEPDQEGGAKPTQGGVVAEDPNQGIEINVHKPASNGGGGADANANEGGLTTLMKVAQDKFQLGKYGESAAAYEKALRMGGDAGRINQRLGQCYQHLNRTSDAIAAYSRAESALQSALNGGRASAKAPLESVRQALQTLRGN